MIRKKSYRFYGTDPLQHGFKRDIDSLELQSNFPNLAYALAGIQYTAILSGTEASSLGSNGDTCGITYSDKEEYYNNVIGNLTGLESHVNQNANELNIFFQSNDIKSYTNNYPNLEKYKKHLLTIVYPTAKIFLNDIKKSKSLNKAQKIKYVKSRNFCSKLNYLLMTIDAFQDNQAHHSAASAKIKVNSYIRSVDPKLEIENKVVDSININDSTMNKNADNISDQYYKDALMGLSNDSFMKAYYSGLSEEYNYKPEAPKRDPKDLMDFFKEEENIVLKSHPNSVFVADALNEGGLIENGLEQKNKIENITKKRPSGNFR